MKTHLAIAGLFLAWSTTLLAADPAKPNILLIVADDLGYSDLGCYGGEISTPNLDGLAADGLRFTQFYNTARCWSSRASLLTGYYAQAIRRDAISHVEGARDGVKAGPGGVRPSWARLLPAYLRPLGYRSYHSGKWHIDGPKLPAGFDHSYSVDGHDDYFNMTAHFADDTKLPPTRPEDQYYATTAIAEHAIQYLKEHAANHPDQPFFQYLAFTSPHFPLQALPEDIALYRDRYTAGWDAIREERFARMKTLGLVDCALSPLDPLTVPSWNLVEAELQQRIGPQEVGHAVSWAQLTAEQQAFQSAKMAIHAAMVHRMDIEIGRVLEQLRTMGTLDNTVVFFLSDNGASAEQIIRGGGHDPAVPPGSSRSYLGLGPGWSSTANTPFRLHKSWVHEGGIATPLIVNWPAGIPAHKELRINPGHVIDLVPTVLDLVGGTVPDSVQGLPVPPLQGRSLLPVFRHDGSVKRDDLWWNHAGNRAIRIGDWKLVADHELPWELYDLNADRSEVNNLASAHPERVQEMAAAWMEQATEFHRLARMDLPPAKPMNVVFILADDLGWADSTLYGHTRLYETPNLERLARRGLTFNRAYSASPLCSPTRSSILTGRNPARTGFTAPEGHLPRVLLKPEVAARAGPERKDTQVSSITRLDTALPTLGKLLKGAGYATAHFGKWHLGAEPYSPLEHGFDVDLPHWPGPGPAGSFVAPWEFPDFKANHPREHIEDRMAEEAVRWMGSLDESQPFFMNYWQFLVHAPFDAKQELIESYRTRVDPGSPQRSPTYAAMVHSLDDAVGRLLDAVDTAGIAARTAIIFISDNGGNMYDEVDGTSPTSNAPLRGGKATLFEGGIRVPCIVVWPGLTQPGTRSNEIIQTTDFYPTLLNLLRIPLPEDYAIDGIDITPALRGGTLPRDALFTYFPHSPPAVPDWLPSSMSVHSGDWKLIRLFYQGEDGAHDYLLFNLADDLSETNNLAARYPEKVALLDGYMEDYIREAGVVVPLRNPNFDPAQYQPERIGIPRREPKGGNADERRNRNPDRMAIDGWQAGGTSSIRKRNGVLAIRSSGSDPFVALQNMAAVGGGPFTVTLRIKSSVADGGVVYYDAPASEACTVWFPIAADRQWQETQATIAKSRLNGLRIDPGQAAGLIEIDWIRLADQSGNYLQQWEFP